MLYENPQPFDVLLVEDDLSDANLVRNAIAQSRVLCNLYHAQDGVDALDFLRNGSECYRDMPKPDLILLDLNMPRMNGAEFLAAIKADENFASIPVVVLTTSDVERDVLAAYQLQASGFITKPVDMGQFVNAMRQLVGYWLAVTRLPRKE